MILLYVCVLDTIYGLVTKKIAVGNLRKIIVTPNSYHDQFTVSDYDFGGNRLPTLLKQVSFSEFIIDRYDVSV
jgi:hypothetical protein